MAIREVKRWEVDGRLFDSRRAAVIWERRVEIKNIIRRWVDELDFAPGSEALRGSIYNVLENTALDGKLRKLVDALDVEAQRQQTEEGP